MKRSKKKYLFFFSRGQISIELIIILAVLLGVFALVLVTANQTVFVARSKMYHDQARLSLDSLVHNAERIYGQGSGARSTILVTFPDNTNSSSVSLHELKLSLLVRGGKVQDVVVHTQINISGSLPSTAGRHSIGLEATSSGVVIS